MWTDYITGGTYIMVFEKLREIIVNQLDISEDDVTLDTNLVEDLEADSLDLVEVIMAIEDEFSIEIPDESMDSFKTVADVVDYIENNT